MPAVAAVVAAMHAPVFLAEQHIRVRRVVRYAVNTLTGRGGSGLHRRVHTLVLPVPGLTAIIGAEEAGSRDADPHAVGIVAVRQNGVSAKAAEARCPVRARRVFVEPIDRLPVLATIAADEQAGLGYTGVECTMRPMQVPDLVDEPTAALEHSGEVFLGDQPMMFGIAAVLRTVTRCGGQLLPVGEVVAGEQRNAIVRTVHRDIGAPPVITRGCGDGPTAQHELTIPASAIVAG